MRINKFVAQATGLSRRAVDQAITEHKVQVNDQPATLGQQISEADRVTLQGKPLPQPSALTPQPLTIMLNKPVGYVVSREGQGSRTIYELLPPEFQHLKPIGRLDKDSSGLLLLTNDGELAHHLTHPKFKKEKVYEIEIDRPLERADFEKITTLGVDIGDNNPNPSRFQLVASSKQQVASDKIPNYFLPATSYWRATLAEGRNRQIRRTFATLGYKVTKLHRTRLGDFELGDLKLGNFTPVIPS